MPKYSIVVPFHNEQENLTLLYDRLTAVMENVGSSFELVFVDDGSTDSTYRLLQEIAAVDSRVVVVRLRRNFGQTAALAAGFDHATGEFIIAMDGDLQHDPNDIPNFIDKLEEGYDIVSGWRKKRIDNFVIRRIPSKIANKMMAKLSGVDIHDFGTTFKAYRADIIRDVPLYGELHRFIPAVASGYGASIVEIPIRNVNRERGVSHYGISRTFRVMFDLLTIRFLLKYLSRPLHFFGRYGALSIITGTLIAFYLMLLKVIYPAASIVDQHGPLLVLASVMIVSGVNLLAFGLLAEMQVRHYYEPSKRSPYVVGRVIKNTPQNEEQVAE
ncbi:MAG TPA: glycosyltransferase family 2 protein [Terriglobales bacterium]